MAFILNEGEGCAAGGGIAGGDMSPGAPAGPGGGIASDAVLGPSGNFERGEGCLGPGDFHVPFPVTPMLRRYRCCNGGSLSKKKKGRKTIAVKNPYAKGMKVVVAEGIEREPVEYAGEAKAWFDRITNRRREAFGEVLYYNDDLGLAWMIDDGGACKIYKPVACGPGILTICSATLGEDGNIYLDRKAGKYRSRRAALDAVRRAAEEHRLKVRRAVSEAVKEAGAGNGRTLVVGMSRDEAVEALKAEEDLIDNDRYDFAQFDKFEEDDSEGLEYAGIFENETGICLAMAVLKHDCPFRGYTYVNEIQRLVKKGAGAQLLKAIEERCPRLWLMCDVRGGEDLQNFYRRPGFALEEYYVENSAYGCPAYFFYTGECEERRLLGYIDAFYDNGGEGGEEEPERVEEKDDLIVDYMNAVEDD